ncbi:hypothetical protein [Roseateles albus]|uniref:hypothetical protein n=1 Tax=Roseateles albus TaxID=2987525 RepID=UPI0039648A8F
MSFFRKNEAAEQSFGDANFVRHGGVHVADCAHMRNEKRYVLRLQVFHADTAQHIRECARYRRIFVICLGTVPFSAGLPRIEAILGRVAP